MRRRAAHLIVAGVLATMPLSGCAALLPRPAVGQVAECDPPAPAGATAAAQAYTDAAHQAHERRVVLSDIIAAQDMMMSRDDMRTAADGDELFLAEVREIAFPAEVRDAARDFVRAVEADDAFLLAAAAEEGYYGVHAGERDRLHETRTRTGRVLREALDQPPTSCSLNLP